MAKQTKATHNGTCQVCGSVQAVHPETGRLAKHGYTVQWGFFLGTCYGSDHFPYEISKDLIEQSIANAKHSALRQRELAEETRKRTADDAVWVSHYRPATWQRRNSGYEWAEVAIAECNVTERTYEWGASYSVEVTNPYNEAGNRKTEVVHGHMVYGDSEANTDNPGNLTWFQYANARRAKAYEKTAEQMDTYAEWQMKRIASWSVQPLMVRKGSR